MKYIRKSVSFNDKLISNMKKWLNINPPNTYFIRKGSYKFRKEGELLSDIDFTVNSTYNESLVKTIRDLIVLNNTDDNSPFKFLRSSFGIKEVYNPPWDFSSENHHYFDIEQALQWVNKSKIASHLLDEAKKVLNRQHISLLDMIELDSELENHYKIMWNEHNLDDFKEVVKYMKKDIPVLEFMYIYEGSFIKIDIGIVDVQLEGKNDNFKNMEKYYFWDWYSILKKMRFDMSDKQRAYYLKDIYRNIGKYIYIYNQIELLESLANTDKYIKQKYYPQLESHITEMLSKQYSIINKDPSESAKEVIKREIDIMSLSLVKKYLPKLNIEKRADIQRKVNRSILSEFKIDRTLIGFRNQLCPLSLLDEHDFNTISDISIRSKISLKKIVDCVLAISDSDGYDLSNVIKWTLNSDSKYSIESDYSSKGFVLKEDNLYIKKINENQKKEIQNMIVFGNKKS